MKWICASIIGAMLIAIVLISYHVEEKSVNILLIFFCIALSAVLVFSGYLGRKKRQTALFKKELEELPNKYNILRTQYDSITHSLKQRTEILQKMNKDSKKVGRMESSDRKMGTRN